MVAPLRLRCGGWVGGWKGGGRRGRARRGASPASCPQDWQVDATLPALDLWVQEGLPVELYQDMFMKDLHGYSDDFPDAQPRSPGTPDLAQQDVPAADEAPLTPGADLRQLWLAEGLPEELFSEEFLQSAREATPPAEEEVLAVAAAAEEWYHEEMAAEPAAMPRREREEEVPALAAAAEEAYQQAQVLMAAEPAGVPQRQRGPKKKQPGKQKKTRLRKKKTRLLKPKASFKHAKKKRKARIPAAAADDGVPEAAAGAPAAGPAEAPGPEPRAAPPAGQRVAAMSTCCVVRGPWNGVHDGQPSRIPHT